MRCLFILLRVAGRTAFLPAFLNAWQLLHRLAVQHCQTSVGRVTPARPHVCTGSTTGVKLIEQQPIHLQVKKSS